MPARLIPQGISTHPQLQRMITSFLAGSPAREIARWSSPKVGHVSISRYMAARVTPALRNAANLLSVDPPRTAPDRAVRAMHNRERKPRITNRQREQKQVEQGQVEQQKQAEQQVERLAVEALVAAPVLSLFRQRLETLHARVDKALDRAESAVRVVNQGGKLVAAGVDLGPLAPLLSVAHKNLEMLGRTTGELEQQSIGSLSIQIVCPGYDPASALAPRISFASGDAIEYSAHEIGLRQLP
jgi:hypothetical protein